MADIDTVEEQTRLLLAEQKLVLELFKDEFSKFSEQISQELDRANKDGDSSLIESCQHVVDLTNDLKEEVIGQIEEDVAFLEKQHEAIERVQRMPDKKEADEVAVMMLEDGQELQNMEEFKENVKEESEAAKQSFIAMIDDMKAVLVESGIQELESLLEAHAMATKESAEDDADECCVDKNCCKDAGDDSCDECPSSCSGCDIFAGVAEGDDQKD